jgi:hypothetical protein
VGICSDFLREHGDDGHETGGSNRRSTPGRLPSAACFSSICVCGRGSSSRSADCPLDVLYLHGAGWQVHIDDLGRYLAGGQSMWKARWEELTPAYQSLRLAK